MLKHVKTKVVKFPCSNLGLFVGKRGAVGLQVLHDALDAAGAEQPEVERTKKHKVTWMLEPGAFRLSGPAETSTRRKRSGSTVVLPVDV